MCRDISGLELTVALESATEQPMSVHFLKVSTKVIKPSLVNSPILIRLWLKTNYNLKLLSVGQSMPYFSMPTLTGTGMPL
jgi:hypothetical protein